MSTIWNLFCGFVVPFPAMPRGWKWLNRLAPTTWVLYALSASQLGHSNQPLIQPSGEITTVSQFLETFFGYRYDFIWYAPCHAPQLSVFQSCMPYAYAGTALSR